MQITAVNYNNQSRNRSFGIGMYPAEYGERLAIRRGQKAAEAIKSVAIPSVTEPSEKQRTVSNFGSSAISRYMDDLLDEMEFRANNR